MAMNRLQNPIWLSGYKRESGKREVHGFYPSGEEVRHIWSVGGKSVNGPEVLDHETAYDEVYRLVLVGVYNTKLTRDSCWYRLLYNAELALRLHLQVVFLTALLPRASSMWSR
jgi:hypothetical protein